MTRLSNLPSVLATARPGRALAKFGSIVVPAMLLASQAFAAAGATNTLGSRMTAASSDLGVGGGYILEFIGYVLGGAALLVGIHTIVQHTKNPNGQSRLGYGFMSVLAGGAFLAASLFATFSANTMAGADVTNTGAAQQMTFQ